MRAALLLLLALSPLALAACGGTVSPERAYEECSERARLAVRPRGTVGLGVGSGGPVGSLDVTITSDFIAGRDPNLVYDSCFRNLTGAGPTRPLIL
ncbi:hypothetical protein [Roseicyclus persicicus]|uniref:Lipoprotein n=1 Tax=Roseicyclus persicicus TaxID=2650661 RepID=A0A7X6GYY8_9RHOB|nr:hypothetical protein [Roseibacterium persicicum]NKX44093.1 hypothetical protein [Roseibacterium persicicum]